MLICAVTNAAHTNLTKLRLQSYATGRFCAFPWKVNGQVITCKFAMERTLTLDLAKATWLESSPEGEFFGTLSEAALTEISRQLARCQKA